MPLSVGMQDRLHLFFENYFKREKISKRKAGTMELRYIFLIMQILLVLNKKSSIPIGAL